MSIKFKVLNSAILLLVTGLSTEIYAACEQKKFTAQDVIMQVGRVVVRPSDQVGKVLAKGTFTMDTVRDALDCRRTTNPGTVTSALTHSFPLSSLGDSIYKTNIPGIGMRLYRKIGQEENSFSGYYPSQRNLQRGTTYSLGEGSFVVEVIKIEENTGSGEIAPGQYSSYYVTDTPDKPLLTSSVVANAITIASSSCEIQGEINKVVQLDTVNKSDFNGVGSTAAEKPFNIRLLCSGGVNGSDVPTSNNISLSFLYNIAPNTTNVIENNRSVPSSRASGVGVQLIWDYKNQNTVVLNNVKQNVETINSNNTKLFDIPMKARYYQTAQNITPGRVSGLAQIIINYD